MTSFVSGDTLHAIWPDATAQAINFLAASSGILVNGAILGTRWRQCLAFIHPKPKAASWRCTIALLLTFITSTAFTFASAFLQFGVGLARSSNICQSGIILCVTAYAATKVFTYLFLLERLFIVSGYHRYRDCKTWIVGAVLFLVGLPILGIFIPSERHQFDNATGVCHLGLAPLGGFMLVAWDLILNLYLSFVFIFRLRGSALHQKSPLRALALKTFLVTVISACTSFVNILVLTILKFERGWLCLSLCTLDVLVDAITLSLLTSATVNEHSQAHNVAASTTASKHYDPSFTLERGGRRQSLVNVQADLLCSQRRPSFTLSRNASSLRDFSLKDAFIDEESPSIPQLGYTPHVTVDVPLQRESKEADEDEEGISPAATPDEISQLDAKV